MLLQKRDGFGTEPCKCVCVEAPAAGSATDTPIYSYPMHFQLVSFLRYFTCFPYFSLFERKGAGTRRGATAEPAAL